MTWVTLVEFHMFLLPFICFLHQSISALAQNTQPTAQDQEKVKSLTQNLTFVVIS